MIYSNCNKIICTCLLSHNQLSTRQVPETMVALGIFFRMFLKKHKLQSNKKRNSYIDNNNNKKTRKYIKFTVVFYKFSYFETVT